MSSNSEWERITTPSQFNRTLDAPPCIRVLKKNKMNQKSGRFNKPGYLLAKSLFNKTRIRFAFEVNPESKTVSLIPSKQGHIVGSKFHTLDVTLASEYFPKEAMSYRLELEGRRLILVPDDTLPVQTRNPNFRKRR